MQGVGVRWVAVLKLLNSLTTVTLTDPDQVWDEQQLVKYRLSHGLEINDCLIAAVCHRLQMPIYTQNVMDMQKMLPPALVIRPFVA